MAKESIGFIGLGIMGLPMARNLLKAGYQVVAYNRTSSKAEELSAGRSDNAATSPREVSERSIRNHNHGHRLPGRGGGRPGPGQRHRGHSTRCRAHRHEHHISPSVTRAIAERVEEKGGRMLDAPVSGGSWGAIEGTLSIMVGGEKSVFDRCLPVFQAMGKNIVHTGPSGMGQTTKLVNQILVAGTMNAVAEAMVFAASSGADLETTIEAVKGGAAGSWQLQNLGPRLIKGDFAPGFMVRLQQKDLRLILEGAREMRLTLPATALINQLFASLEASGNGDEGTQALVKVHERLAGIEARVK